MKKRLPNPLDHGSPLEEALEPDLPIIDPHHHLWGRSLTLLRGKHPDDPDLSDFEFVSANNPRYLLDDFLKDIAMGHNVRASVFVQAHAMYNIDGPAAMAPVGETEFVNGIAAMSASGIYGPCRVAAGIVGYADLRDSDGLMPLLEAHIRAGNGRFRGIRQGGAWDADMTILGTLSGQSKGLYRDPKFREGFAALAPLGLSFDAWVLEPQLDDMIDLARAFPDTRIVLDHVGSPIGIGAYSGTREARFPEWRRNMCALAELPNVYVKLGGLGMPFQAFDACLAYPRHSSLMLADQWRPYITSCIELFGANRCMFESNFPVDRASGDYATIWNAFKRIASHASPDEKAALFAGTAAEFYRLPPSLWQPD